MHLGTRSAVTGADLDRSSVPVPDWPLEIGTIQADSDGIVRAGPLRVMQRVTVREVSPVSQTVSPRQHTFTLNTDGRPHPMANSLALLAACFAVIAVVCAWFPSMHLLGSWAGLVGLGTGLWSQMISATTAERWINVSAMILSGLGLMFGLAHGGLY